MHIERKSSKAFSREDWKCAEIMYRLMREQIVISALCSLGMVIFPNSSFHVVAALGGSPALALQVQIPVTDNGPEVYMSLYYDAVNFLVRPAGSDESLATILHRASSAKTKASQVYALVSEATKWSSVLSGIIEQTEILKHEKKVHLPQHVCKVMPTVLMTA